MAPTETPEPTPNGYSLTPGGNAELVDDLHDMDRDFITVQTRDGNTFYIVIDRTKDNSENVYFLNMVDAADLLPLLKDSDISSGRITCTCSERCEQGHVNLNCPVCASNIADCQGHEGESLTENESSATAKPDTSSDSDENSKKASAPSAQSIVALVVIIAVIAAAVVFMLKKKNGKGTKLKKQTQSDFDYDYDDDDDDKHGTVSNSNKEDDDNGFTEEDDDPDII